MAGLPFALTCPLLAGRPEIGRMVYASSGSNFHCSMQSDSQRSDTMWMGEARLPSVFQRVATVTIGSSHSLVAQAESSHTRCVVRSRESVARSLHPMDRTSSRAKSCISLSSPSSKVMTSSRIRGMPW